ncbi:LysM domain-containing protein [Butyrivibrio sp. INlla18]|uniref:LysM peptidoglycan-binding domain-containing protein n=1 Tax=Butyrivibrio sp. INlla18 TaxID=1520806 RepID=UPI00088A45F3|nr:LysM peptidoglycan-binding domain-containing protein [Butyrivibrio sp. INlla18]SDA65113.1 LysM domain-containing protein [Butyrivibrio sp. INlla18]
MSDAMLAAARLYNNPRYFDPSEIRIRQNKIRRQRIVRRQYITISLIVSILLFVMMFLKLSVMSDAQSDTFEPEYKYYKTVTVYSGDTLWDIASNNYNSGKYSDMNSYINEILSINSISDADQVKAGESLIIPYFSKEYK